MYADNCLVTEKKTSLSIEFFLSPLPYSHITCYKTEAKQVGVLCMCIGRAGLQLRMGAPRTVNHHFHPFALKGF